MPYKPGYTSSDEISSPRGALAWPDGAQCAVQIVVNLNLALSADGICESDLATDKAHFALHEGLDTILRMLDAFGLKATFAVPGILARLLPVRMAALRDAGHEIAAQALFGEDVSSLPEDEELLRLKATSDSIAEATGSRPAGWFSLPRPSDAYASGMVSEHTPRLLCLAGYRYLGSGLADDIPHYWVTDAEKGSSLLTMPYYYHQDDQYFALFPAQGSGIENTDMLARNWHTEFAAQHARGRYFSMTLHPLHSGWGHRSEFLARFWKSMTSCSKIWNPTVDECARYWLKTYPAEAALRLESPIWKDYPDSLS